MNCLLSLPSEFIPATHSMGSSIQSLLKSVPIKRSVGPNAVLDDFLGDHPKQLDGKFTGIHHLAFYVGDYRTETDVECWHDHLKQLLMKKLILTLDHGPSYISPKYYGTPGWWFSVKMQDGFPLEMFCCRHFGKWASYSAQRRKRLMSHYALSVESKKGLIATLNQFKQKKEIELIAYTEGDEMGHTYGHIRNNKKSRVLEIIVDV